MGLSNQVRRNLQRYQTNRRYEGQIRTAALTLKSNQSGSIFITKGATGQVTFTLPTNAAYGVCYTFVVGAAQELRIKPGAGEKIGYTISATYAVQTAAKYATADAVGERMTIVSDGEGNWYAIDQAGTWTEES